MLQGDQINIAVCLVYASVHAHIGKVTFYHVPEAQGNVKPVTLYLRSTRPGVSDPGALLQFSLAVGSPLHLVHHDQSWPGLC